MDMQNAVQALAALAHERRLAAFRLLVRAGTSGLPAGDIASELDIPNNTLSTHLAALTRAGLLNAQRDGRHIFYRANFDGMRALLGFLLKDCCQADASFTQRALACLDMPCTAANPNMESTK
jgi:DNA-binding transcriptional ArsR family regulator